MKVTYYKYFIENGGNRYQFKILPTLKNFCKIKDQKFRRSFLTPAEDNLFLFHIDSCTFLFVLTKNNELIKTISGDSMSHEDIYEKLNADESLGFASYIFVGHNYYGIASTFFGPKNSYWLHFINQLFEKLGLEHYCLGSEPFPVETTKQSALKFSFKGQTLIRINNSSPYFNQLSGLFGGGKNEAGSFTIEIKPEVRKDMPKTFDSVINTIPLEGVEKFIVRGKEHFEDSMTDYYIVGSGHISDSIAIKDESKICQAIEEKVSKNRQLKEAVAKYAKDDTYIKDDIPGISCYSDLDNWPWDI